MKRIILAVLIGLCGVANAQHHRHYGHHHGGHWGNWVAPAIIGGVVTYAITRPVQPAPVIIQQPPIVQSYPTAPYGYHYENILDANCNCYRLVLVQNQP
jgi:hypothetical protein